MTSWMEVFDPEEKGYVEGDQFDRMLVVLNDVLQRPLEAELLQNLMSKRYMVTESSTPDVDLEALSQILKLTAIKDWTDAHRLHLLTYVANDANARSVPFKRFLQGLIFLQQNVLGVLSSTADHMKLQPHAPKRMDQGEKEDEEQDPYRHVEQKSSSLEPI